MKAKLKLSPIFIVGFFLVLISFSLFMIFRQMDTNDIEGYSFICFIIAAAYGGYSIANYFAYKKKEGYNGNHFVWVLSLFSISCFCLNLDFQIFSELVLGVSIILILFHLALVVHVFRHNVPKYLVTFNYLIVGVGATIVLFYSLFMVPLWGIGFIGMILFGLTIHVYIPFVLFLVALILFFKAKRTYYDNISFSIGASLPLIAVVILIYWNAQIADSMHRKSAEILTGQTSSLPDWVELSQRMPNNYFTERILKSGLLYEDELLSNWGWNSIGSFDEMKKNDPVLAVAMLLSPDLNLSDKARINILNTSFNTRHLSRRKLWRGDNLSTSEVLTNIRLYPDYRIAYTEKIISIKNSSSWQRNQQEALYSFKLPEGSTATSLSLWINGVEEKSRLSTRKKADSAYTTIVGVERRDPSILHWQEGNIVTIAVFPCTPAENRRFKLGYTSPMKFENGKLYYEAEHITGPPIKACRESVLLRIKDDKAFHPIGLKNFDSKSINEYIYTGRGCKQIAFSIKSPPLSEESFLFDGEAYKVSPIAYELQDINIQTVYMDVNSHWTKREYDNILKMCANKKVFIYDDKLITIESQASSALFRSVVEKNYSLFPFHFIPDAESSIVITKSNYISPNIDELKESEFGKNLIVYLLNMTESINVINLGGELSPYLETLKQFDCFNYMEGNIGDLKEIVENNQIRRIVKTSNTVYIPKAEMQISMDSNLQHGGQGNEHLMRLYAYNSIIQKAGGAYFGDKDAMIEELVPIAEKAFITSPVSSLIVLETVADYERFGIEENKNSLGNASANSSGAVPEPHEWVLIILALSIVLYFSYRKKIQWILLRK
ncbi:MAG: XrtN system VIT domain-containing protein [Bacteroidetes bacterium]|nr:XrtN system VIT domain-containing protein [Bacteroidota bacterium]